MTANQIGRLEGQVAWVSGGASGIGEGIADLFAQQGAKVAIADIQLERGQEIADRINRSGGQAIFVGCDVAQSDQVFDSIHRAVKQFGGIQIIVNSAGIIHVALLHEYAETDWDQLMGVNVKSVYLSVKHGIEHLRKNPRSYVVNVASVGSYGTQAKSPGYITSKHAVLGLTRSIAADYASEGLRCNCICPGITDTPMLRKHMNTMPDPEAALAQRLTRVPMNLALTPNDIARTALYLACEDSAGVTGTSVVVDGGYTACAEWDSTQ